MESPGAILMLSAPPGGVISVLSTPKGGAVKAYLCFNFGRLTTKAKPKLTKKSVVMKLREI